MIGHYEKIQHYSTKDGPGIRTTVFLCGCNLRCKWCANPELIKPDGNIFYYKDRCRHCMTCINASNGSITLADQGVKIDRQKCKNLEEIADMCLYDAYEVIRKDIDSDELVNILIKDKVFYDKSGGGVTFSGGEALLQKDFVLDCTRKLHQNGISVCLDTAGNFEWSQIEELVKEVDYVLYDVKAYDENIHIKCTEVSNKRILENLKKIDDLGKKTLIRMIIVPKMNDDISDIKARIDYCASLQNVTQIDFLKYHILGVGKYEKLGLQYTLNDIGEVSDKLIDEVVAYANSKNIKNTIGG